MVCYPLIIRASFLRYQFWDGSISISVSEEEQVLDIRYPLYSEAIRFRFTLGEIPLFSLSVHIHKGVVMTTERD